MLGHASRPLGADPRRLATILAEQATTPLAGYGVALGCIVLAMGLRLVLELLTPGVVPFAPPFPAILVAGLVGGAGPGLLALILGGFLAAYFLLPPRMTLDLLAAADAVSLVLYLLSGGIVLAVALALRQSRAQLQRVLDTTPMAILESDGEGVFTYANPSAQRLLGLTPTEIRGRPYDAPAWQLATPDGQPIPRDLLPGTRALKGETIVDYEHALIDQRTGRRRVVSVNTTPVRGRDGSVAGVVVGLLDVTARHEAERALRESEARLRLAVEATGLGTWDVDVAAGTRRWSPAFLAITGLPASTEPDPALFSTLIHPDDRAWVNERYRAAYDPAGDGRYEAEFRIRRADDGAERWVLTLGRIYFDLAGQPLRGIGILMDITDRKRAEAALRESERTLRAFYDSAPVLMGVVELPEDEDDVLHVDDNAASCRFFGVPPGTTAGRTAQALGASPATIGTWIARYRESRSRNRPVRFDHAYVAPDGEYLLAVAVAHIGPAASGRDRFCYVAEDVTERRHAEAALRTSEARLRAVVESLPFDFWVIDRDGRYVLQNSASRANWGDRVGLRPEETDTPPAVAARWQENNRRALAGELVRGEEIHGSNGRVRHVDKIVAPIRDGEAILGAVGINIDITARREAEAARARLARILEATPDLVSIARADGEVIYLNRAARRVLGLPLEGEVEGWRIPMGQPERVRQLVLEVAIPTALREGSWSGETAVVMGDGRELPVSQVVLAHCGPDGVTYLSTIARDISERKAAEERLRLLLHELSHRVKNTLAVVRSIAQRSLSGERTIEEARDVLTRRLQALASAHDLLTASAWRGASMRALARAELKPYGRRAVVAGPDLTLLPKAAQTLALVLHELATNAAKHGALSALDGRVEVGWSLDDGAEPAWLRLVWREHDGPRLAAPPERLGFGRTLIEQGVRHDLDGEVTLAFQPEGLVCTLAVPAEAAVAEHGAGERAEAAATC